MGAKFSEWLIVIIFLIVGTGLTIGGVFSTVSTIKFKKIALETTAEVLDVRKQIDYDENTSYTVYVSYNVGDQKYNSKYTISSYVREGSNIKIYYDPNNPNKIRATTTNIPGIILSIIGIPCCAIGLGVFIFKLNKISTKKYLLENGQRIFADIQEINVNYSYSVNYRHPFIIICKGKDLNGVNRIFKSENLWYNPNPIIKQKNITSLPVYIDINNQKKYYVSLENIGENEL